MDTRVRELVEQGNRLFSKRQPLLSLWQSIAEQFCPERADFTSTLSMGSEFAAHLMTGRPLMAMRDLANSISAMLRPADKIWLHASTMNEDINQDASARQWLDMASEVQHRAMYDPLSQFVRSTKQADFDFIGFGQAVLTVDTNRDFSRLLIRNWHLRDTVWCEDEERQITRVDRDWKLEAKNLVKLFPKTASDKVKTLLDKEPYKEVQCRHIIMPWDDYDLTKQKAGGKKFPFVSIYVDTENDTILGEVGAPEINYVIPRWKIYPGTQYAFSPATMAALPDARLIQQITLTLLEAGQKVVDPPAVVQGGVIQGDANFYAGGMTVLDSEYDERLGEGVRFLPIDGRGLNWGDKREQMIHEMISEAFYLNQIVLPEIGADMTAYEVQKRVEEYTRRALPLFEPMENEYNGMLCEKVFGLMLRNNAFGSPFDMPAILRKQEVKFKFDGPLRSAADRAKAQQFVQSIQLTTTAAQLDPGVIFDFDTRKGYRDAFLGTGSSDWLLDQKVADKKRAVADQQKQMEQLAQTVAGGADLATRVGTATKTLQDAGMVS